jgi:hypothetical protein
LEICCGKRSTDSDLRCGELLWNLERTVLIYTRLRREFKGEKEEKMEHKAA